MIGPDGQVGTVREIQLAFVQDGLAAQRHIAVRPRRRQIHIILEMIARKAGFQLAADRPGVLREYLLQADDIGLAGPEETGHGICTRGRIGDLPVAGLGEMAHIPRHDTHFLPGRLVRSGRELQDAAEQRQRAQKRDQRDPGRLRPADHGPHQQAAVQQHQREIEHAQNGYPPGF